MDRDLLFLVARVCLSAVFIFSAVDKYINWRRALAFTENLRVPQPQLVLWLTILVQFFGGLAVLTGVYARASAIALIAFTVLATLAAHNPVRLRGDAFSQQMTISLEHLAIAGGLLLIAIEGPGALTLRD